MPRLTDCLATPSNQVQARLSEKRCVVTCQ